MMGDFSHPSTNQARSCLASEIRRDRARSGWYGHRLWHRFSRHNFNFCFRFSGREGGAEPKHRRLISAPCPPVPPDVTVFPNNPVELGEPNTLICFIDKFSPPLVNVTWLRNGKPLTTGVSETVFLPREDHLFRKFYYLPFLPSAEDVYDCKVEHWGLDEPLLKHWGTNQPFVSLFYGFRLWSVVLWDTAQSPIL